MKLRCWPYPVQQGSLEYGTISSGARTGDEHDLWIDEVLAGPLLSSFGILKTAMLDMQAIVVLRGIPEVDVTAAVGYGHDIPLPKRIAGIIGVRKSRAPVIGIVGAVRVYI